MVTAAGSGYSRWHDIAVTRWREDVTRDDWGAYIFLRDVRSGDVWSAGYQPSCRRTRQLRRSTSPKIAPRSSGATAPSRRRWRSWSRRKTMPRCAAFPSPITASNARDRNDLLCRNRAGAASRTMSRIRPSPNCSWRRSSCPISARSLRRGGAFARRPAGLGGASRRRRGRNIRRRAIRDRPRALPRPRADRPLARRHHRRLAAFQHRRPRAGPDLQPAPARASPARGNGRASPSGPWPRRRARRCSISPTSIMTDGVRARTTLAWTQAQMQLHHLGIAADEAHLFQRLANHVLYSDPCAAAARGCPRARRGQGIDALGAGHFGRPADRAGAHRRGRRYRPRPPAAARARILAAKQLAVDLVILNERAASYAQDLQIALDALVRMNQSMPKIRGRPVRAAQCSCCAPI